MVLKKTFNVCSLTGRINGLMKLLSSLKEYSDWKMTIVLQKYSEHESAIIEMHTKSVFKNYSIYKTDEMTGPHVARCIALDRERSDVWCILDDDMWAVAGKTDYNRMAKIIWERNDIGFVSANWRRNEEQVIKTEQKEKLLKQNIVYTGGGMMFRQDVADIIRNIPRTMYVFDNPLWSIYSYVNGYDNYRYLGSVAVHAICTKGGRIKWLKENDGKKALPPSDWITTRRGKGGKGSNDEYLICDSGDITELAHKLHKERQKS